MAKTVNRHLNYAWIEYGNPRDGGAFTRGLEKLGWRNLFSQLPVKTDAWGIRAQLKSHPLLPIRWRANSLLALPNERHDMPGKPFIGDPLFEAYRKANDDKKFDQAIIDQNADVATWVFSPGLRKEGEEEFHWTAGSDATDYADLVAISGHGAAGNVWGGRRTASLFLALSRAGDSASPRLKYVIVPACTNLSEMNLEGWLPAFRRKPYPLHGAFGYENSYPGDQPGQMIFQQFVTNLAAGGGAENTILEAYKKAHSGPLSYRWAALMHKSAVKDTMRDWLDEKLKTPEPDGELLYFNKSNESGKTPVFPDRTFVPYFRKNGERITVANREASAFLFKNGNKGELELSTDTGEFKDGDVVHVVFHYYRDNKPGMDLHKLLTFGAWSGGAVAVLRDLNKNDGAWAEADGIEVAFSATTKQAIIPFTIQSDAFEKYHKETSYFWVKLSAPNLDPAPTDPPFYSQGFWLAG